MHLREMFTKIYNCAKRLKFCADWDDEDNVEVFKWLRVKSLSQYNQTDNNTDFARSAIKYLTT